MPMGIGPGLSVTRFESGAWFDAAAYVDLAAIADFNNNQYALPAFGPEAVTNGTFDTNLTGWLQTSGGWSWSGGKATLTGDGSPQSIYQPCLTVGSLYLIEFDVTASGGGGQIGFSNAGGGIIAQGSSGRVSAYWTADTVNLSFKRNTGTVNGTIDNVSVREVLLTRNAVALGPNLVPGTGTNRSLGTGTATYTGGTLTLVGTNSTNTGAYEFPLVTQAGREYRITFTVAGASTFCGLWDQPNQGSVIGGTAATRTAGFHTIEFTATDADSYLVFGNTSAGGTSTITGITAQELPATGSYPKRSATFAEWFAFTAASTTARSYVASDGLWKNDLAANAPRFDFRNGKRQLRLENAGVNTFVPSVGNTAQGGGLTLTQNFALAPDGNMTARRVQWTSTANAFSFTTNSIVNVAGVPYTGSTWVKPNNGTSSGTISFQLSKLDSTQAARVNFFSATNTVTTSSSGADVSNVSGAIVEVRNGWYRISITATFANSYSPTGFTGGINCVFANGDFLTWGDKIEQNSFASDPILAISATATRETETARFSPLLEAIMQRAAASVVVRGALTRPATSTGARIIGTDGNTGFVVAESTTTAINNSGTSLQVPGLAANWPNAAFGASSGYDSAGKALTVNNSTVASSTAVVGTRTSVYLARDAFVSVYADGLYDFVGISPERLSNATLKALAVPA